MAFLELNFRNCHVNVSYSIHMKDRITESRKEPQMAGVKFTRMDWIP